jgi:hypothetical protein
LNGIKNAKVKKYLIFLIIILVLAVVFLFNCFRHNSTADYSDKTVKGNLSAITTFNFSKVATIEDQVKALDNTSSANVFNGRDSLTKAQYQKIFATSVVLGDSITEGLSAYGYLNSDQVFCKIGGSILSGDSMFESAAATYPRFAFFSFGMNDMGNYRGNSGNFIAKYKKLLKAFKKKSPSTRLFINSISMPSDKAMSKNKSLKNYREFNQALKKMCGDLHITYIDNTYILEENPKLYAADGIHVNTGYYPLWLNNMILKAGL